MQDYMRALQDRFDMEPPMDAEMKDEADQIFKDLCCSLGRAERNRLLRLVDIQDARREKTALQSFISGYKLAQGIHRELTDEPLYSYEREQEDRARRSFMTNYRKEEQDGETKTCR